MRIISGLLLGIATLGLGAGQFKPADPSQQAPPGQARHGEEPPTFSAQVSLVRILTSVRDRSGAVITTLNKGDFQISDNDTPQQVSIFERNTSLPLSVAMLVDTSGSTNRSLPYETQSIHRFVTALLGAGNPQDAFELFSFNWRTNLELDFTRSSKRVERALHSLRGDGGTSLYDSVFLASDTLANREGRRVMIIVTDGGDTTSYKKYNDALASAQQVDAVVYPIVVVPVSGDPGRNLGGEHALETLANSTGGRAFSPTGSRELDDTFSDILRELRTQYLIGFYPRNVLQRPRSFHSVRVSLNDPNLVVSARSGYYEP